MCVSLLWRRIWRALFAFVIVGGLSFPLLYELAILVHPAVTSDGLHRVMPIGQVAFAMIFAPVAGSIAAWLAASGASRRSSPRGERVE